LRAAWVLLSAAQARDFTQIFLQFGQTAKHHLPPLRTLAAAHTLILSQPTNSNHHHPKIIKNIITTYHFHPTTNNHYKSSLLKQQQNQIPLIFLTTP
jgi:hypothetical protein